MAKRKQLLTTEDAVPATGQHTKCCSDCPWSRASLRGWLGGVDPDTWLREAHGEAVIDCHTLEGAQCAGAAIYRANCLKRPRDPNVLQLGKDPKLVFASPIEFLAHHKAHPKPEEE